MAAGSAYFPFYVFMHGDQFSPPRISFERLDDATPDPLPVADQSERNAVAALEGIDQSITGTVADSDTASSRNRAAEQEPPESLRNPERLQTPTFVTSSYRLVYASGSSALISDGVDVMAIARGSKLPDGRMVKRVYKTKSGWRLELSGNVEIALSN